LKEEKTISPLTAILIIILTFAALILIEIVREILIYFAVFDFPLSAQIVSVIGELLFLLVPLAYMLHRKIDVKSYIKLGENKLKGLLLGIGLGLGSWVMGIFLTIALTYVLGPSQTVIEANKTITSFATQSTISLALLALALFLAGICEEFAFRGFLQNALESRYSSSIAIIGTSLAFGLAHFDPHAIYSIVVFAYGLVWGYAYTRLKSYIAVASAHMVTDLTSLAIILLLIHMGPA
jgi:membrane protease YdiL (CAAX protease family)